MFDGNHRTRRNINLSSSTKRSSRLHRSSNRGNRGSLDSSSRDGNSSSGRRGNASEILEEARKSREIRLLNFKRTKASICVQRSWRGFSARVALVRQLLLQLDRDSDYHIDTNINTGNHANHVSSEAGAKSSPSMQRLALIWKSATALLMPSLVTLVAHSSSRTHNSTSNANSLFATIDNGGDEFCRINSSDENVAFIAQILLKLESSLRLFYHHLCQSEHQSQQYQSIKSIFQLVQVLVGESPASSASSSKLQSIIVFRRIVLHCLYCLQTVLQNQQFQQTSHQSTTNSILNLLTFIVDYDESDNHEMLQTILPMAEYSSAATCTSASSQFIILSTFTRCCQSYFHKLASLSSSSKVTQETRQFIFHITSQLMKCACLSIPTIKLTSTVTCSSTSRANAIVLSYSTAAMKHLSAILLGLDLQSCFASSSDLMEDASSNISAYEVFHQCAMNFFTKHGFSSTVHPHTSEDDEIIDKKMIVLLLKSLDVQSRNIDPSKLREPTHHSQLINILMSGNELIYIKNSLSCLEYVDKNKKNIVLSSQLEDEYRAICSITIRLLASIMTVQSNEDDKECEKSVQGGSAKDGRPLLQKLPTSSHQTQVLNTLICIVAKGESINAQNLISASSKNFNDNDDDGEFDINMDEPFENHDSNGHTTNSFKSHTSNTVTRQKRQDIQTIIKFDQLYQIKVNKARQEALAYLRNTNASTLQTLLQVSNAIGSGSLVLKLALVVFPSPQMKKRKSMTDDDDSNTVGEAMATNLDDLDSLKDQFISLLSKTLMYCTGTKPRACAMSPILSKIAFQPSLMEQLWKFTKTSLEKLSVEKDPYEYSKKSIKAFDAATSFCDLFVQNLLAMDDEEFLLSYTIVNSNGKPRSTIHASELIEILKVHLYNLYWAKPVVVDEVDIPSIEMVSTISSKESCQRARFMLSGTKLWNALHQRWSRLNPTTKFCEQDCWHFPRLITRGNDEDGALYDTRVDASLDMNVDDDDENMADIDDENDQVRNHLTIADEESDELASSFKDPKMARILTSIPQAIPFDRRVKLFTSLLTADLARMQDETIAQQQMMRRMMDGEEGVEFEGRINAKIHRDRLYEDSMAQLNKHGAKLRKKVAVTFYNQGGALEAGIDGGGVFREFLNDLIKEAFDPEKKHDGLGPLFVVSPLQTLAVNTKLPPTAQVLAHYQFLGRVL